MHQNSEFSRAPPRTTLGELTGALPRPPSWWLGGSLHPSQRLPPLSVLRASSVSHSAHPHFIPWWRLCRSPR